MNTIVTDGVDTDTIDSDKIRVDGDRIMENKLVENNHISKSVTSKVLGKDLRDLKLYKITNFEERHEKMRYRNGLNVDCLEVDEKSLTGLYFFELKDILNYVYMDGYWIREVFLDYEEPVYCMEKKYRAKRINLGPRMRLDNFLIEDLDLLNEIVEGLEDRYRPVGITRFISYKSSNNYPEQVTEIMLKACKKSGLEFGFIPNYCKKLINEEIVKTVCKTNGRCVMNLHEKFLTKEILEIACNENGEALYFIPINMITKELCEIACKNNGSSIRYVPNELLTYDICKIAVDNDNRSIRFLPEEFKRMFKVQPIIYKDDRSFKSKNNKQSKPFKKSNKN